MEQQHSNIERKKNPMDAKVNPTFKWRVPESSIVTDLCPWLPRPYPTRRPSTAPGGSRDTYFSDYPCYSAEAAEWQQLKQPPHIQPELTPVHLPQSRYEAGPSLLPSVQAKLYKRAIMGEIIERRMYKEKDIQQLCRQYIKMNPLAHRDILRQVIAEVKEELNVR
eukprot:jgi/Chrzof1/11187/Cz05g27110.t1